MLKRSCVLSFCMGLALFADLVALAYSSQARDGSDQAPPTQNFSVKDCSPCLLKIQRGEGDVELRFKLRNLSDGTRVIEELVLSRQGSAKQVLPVHDMTPLEPSAEFFVGTADINFDGFNDLFVITSQGVANSYADYWLFLPSSSSFSYLGNYPVFTIDENKRQLSSYERGGYGGMEYEKKQYKFINGELVVIAAEKQEPTSRQSAFHKILMQRKAGKLQEVARVSLASSASSDETIWGGPQNCRVSVPAAWKGRTLSWNGPCAAGKANGAGVLRGYKKGGETLLFFGEIEGGELAHGVIEERNGYIAGDFHHGSLAPNSERNTVISAFEKASAAARKFSNELREKGNEASAAFYMKKAEELERQMD